jgi:DNA-binding MarR family transcriptional regulator
MAQTVSDLEADGYVMRTPDPGDRRRALVSLTDRGIERLEADRRHREGWLAALIAGEMSQREQEILAEAVPLLRRLAEG